MGRLKGATMEVTFTNTEATFETKGVLIREEYMHGTKRPVAIVTVDSDDFGAVKEAFTSGGAWFVTDKGEPDTYGAYNIVCRVADECNGSCTVWMGKKTQVEELEEENAALLFQLLTGEVLA